MARVAVIASSAPSLINFRGELLKAMVCRGHKVFALAPQGHPRSAEIAEQLGSMNAEYVPFTMNRRGLSPLGDLRSLKELTDVLRYRGVEHVLSYTAKPVIYGSLAARRAGIKRIYSLITGLGYAFSTNHWRATVVRTVSLALYRAALRYNARVFFQNPDDRYLFERLGVLRHREKGVLVNGSGVDLNTFTPARMPDEPSFLLIARLIAEKGVRDYVEAARLVKKRYPHVRFQLVGSFETGAHRISESEVEQWVDEGIIEYLGTLKDVRPAIRDCSVFVLPTYYREGQPRTILESMAMARPIITTDNPGSRETVQHGVNGFLIQPRDVQSLVDAMIRFLEHPEYLVTMGEASRRIAEEKYDVHKVNAHMLEVMGL